MSATEKGLLFNSTRKFPSFEMLNIKCLIVGAGDDIINKVPLADIEDGMALSVTADSTDLSLRKGVLYLRVDGEWISINAGTHTHTSSNDGGKLTQVFVRGTYDLWEINYTNPARFNTITSAAGGTATMDTNGFLDLDTNGTTNNVINCFERGLLYTFAQPLSFIARLKLSDQTSSYMTRFGFNGDPAETASPSITKPQMIIEGCDTCNTNKVSIVSGNGTDRTKDTTPITDLVTDVANYIMELLPTETKIYYKRNNVTFVNKGDFVPSTGVPNRQHLFIAGIQTKNTTEKHMNIYGFRASGTIGETNWNDRTLLV